MLQGGIDPAYVLDEMQPYELSALIGNLYYKDKENWEQARLIAYIIALVNSTKKLKAEDIIKFSWDNEQKHETTKITEDDIERLTKKAEEYERSCSKTDSIE